MSAWWDSPEYQTAKVDMVAARDEADVLAHSIASLIACGSLPPREMVNEYLARRGERDAAARRVAELMPQEVLQ